MIVILKTLHFLSLWAAGGAGAGGWIIQIVHARKGVKPSPEVGQAMRSMALVALIAVIVLWITGSALSFAIYGGFPNIVAFHVKLAAAALVLLGLFGSNLEMLRAMRAKTPPRPQVMSKLAWLVRGSLLIVLVSATLAFSGKM
ncbi:hypothetical protein [Thalassovita mangrovi]|uniref:Copper resistance protein D domain-containing protein n=1 Tax=Thalassovita mangrovi TaxID=2692236 RepID=A0A6L8LIS6_9RHOB|nr:hypothetical protein [Thalassovita mangrovi]MYM55918.1 hypothetical protein [Thalassovita mangrovi]